MNLIDALYDIAMHDGVDKLLSKKVDACLSYRDIDRDKREFYLETIKPYCSRGTDWAGVKDYYHEHFANKTAPSISIETESAIDVIDALFSIFSSPDIKHADGIDFCKDFIHKTWATVSGGYHVKIENVVIPKYVFADGFLIKVVKIQKFSFSNNERIKSVSIPDSVTSIGESAFSDCSSLQSVAIPGSVTSIGEYAFNDCKSLQSVAIPGSVISIGKGAFSDCSSLQSVTIPGSVTSIGELTFFGCSSLKSVTIPGSVTSIGKGAFGDCKSLQSVAIPGSVTSIDDWAFSGCSSLKSVTIPRSITSIDSSAFLECQSLENIFVDPENPNYCDIGGVMFLKDGKTLWICPETKDVIDDL